jgi:predicted oxidoreductase (fatty acid repression mutant protein)
LGGKFIGIIGEYVPYREVAISAQTGRARVIFEENTGLSKVWSVDFIKEIIDSDKFKEQLKKIQGN